MRVHPLLLAALLACAAPAPGAFAHAVLMGSEPEARATVAPGPAELVLRFNSRMDRARSRLVLVRPDRMEAVLAPRDDGPPNTLRPRADTAAPGAYVLRWQVLAVDGHITRGELPFTVAPGVVAPGAAVFDPSAPGVMAACRLSATSPPRAKLSPCPTKRPSAFCPSGRIACGDGAGHGG